ncbi:hypothetical protein [Pseudomonas putida]|uniref:hypothetical protein n=1 Tax=Pseudomonas putida TaxID=303 RepID=UPI00330DEE0B|nr:hypothetical protein [Pseudomonas putida]
MADNMQMCWEWLNDRSRFASVIIDFERNDTYKHHRVVWHVKGFGWCDATGQSFEEAVLNAIKTRVDNESLEYFTPE